MADYHYRSLAPSESGRIREIDASQYIRRAYREVDGTRQLVLINYQDPDFPEGFENHLERLQKTIDDGGFAYGVFHEEDALVGFITVNPEVFGSTSKYVLLDQLFISLPHREKGIGTKLLEYAKEAASFWGAEKLYICAGSAEETIAFYFAQGAVEALEINPLLYENDPRDFQLELSLSPNSSIPHTF